MNEYAEPGELQNLGARPRRSLEQLKSRDQEAHYHALIGDIARQFVHVGRKWEPEDMKRLLVDAFRRETKDDPVFREEWAKFGTLRLAPPLDGSDGFVALGYPTRKFGKLLASAFIEWLLAFGAENGVRFKTDVQADSCATT